MSILAAVQMTKVYGTRNNPIPVLTPINLEIPKGSFTVILGRSGSGKSTLLNLLAGLDTPTKGHIEFEGRQLSRKSNDLAKYRSSLGIIFQFYNLLPNLNTIENVLMGGWAGNTHPSPTQARNLLKQLGLEHRTNADVKTLSGGEKQRVAIARALIGNPQILFCDEPTGALDTKSELEVQHILQELHTKEGKTIVLVTHNPEFQKIATQTVQMKDGAISNIIKN
jgi:putative ABC transport system ATP-binding protein